MPTGASEPVQSRGAHGLTGSSLAAALLVIASVGAWWLLHRYWFMAGDDYVHVGVGQHAGGRFTARDWWAALVEDWTVRNGRVADAAVRLVLRPGTWFYPLFAPVMLTGIGVAAAWAALRGRMGRPSVWVWAAGLLLLPTIFWLQPAFAGDGVFWASGAMNYAFPLGLLIASLGVFAHLVSGGDMPWWAMVPAVLLVVLTDAVQEMSSLAQLFVVLAVVIAGWRRMNAKLWVLSGTAVVTFIAHMSAPGLWKRAGIVADAAPGGTVERLANAVTISSSLLWERTSLLWLPVIGLCVLTALRGGAKRLDRIAGWVGAAGATSFFLAASIYRSRVSAGTLPAGPLEGVGPYTALVVLTLAVAGIAVALSLWRAVPLLGYVPLLSWVAYFGNCGFVFASGIYGTRAQFPPTVLLALVLFGSVAALARTVRADRVAAAAVIAAMLVPSLAWADATRVRLARNHAFVQSRVITPLREASGVESGAVVIPALPPYPELTYGRAFQLPSLNGWFHAYFDIPGGVELSNPPA